MSTSPDRLEIPAKVENLNAVLSFIERRLEETDCPLKAQMQISVAAEEIFVNIASYAYAPGTGMAELYLSVSDDPGAISLRFVDSGTPFDPLARDDPDVSLSAEERAVGGLGIYMTKKTMDEVRYEYRDGKNMLTMTKRF